MGNHKRKHDVNLIRTVIRSRKGNLRRAWLALRLAGTDIGYGVLYAIVRRDAIPFSPQERNKRAIADAVRAEWRNAGKPTAAALDTFARWIGFSRIYIDDCLSDGPVSKADERRVLKVAKETIGKAPAVPAAEPPQAIPSSGKEEALKTKPICSICQRLIEEVDLEDKRRRGVVIGMTPEARAKALRALDKIEARNAMVEMIKNERNVHAGAMSAARSRTKAKMGGAA